MAGDVLPRVAAALARAFDIVDDVGGADGILSLIDTTVDDDYLRRAGPDLKIVANYGVGVDNVDLDAAARRNVLVTNTPDVLTRATAEFTIALTLALLRRVVEGDRLVRRRDPWRFAVGFMLGEGLDGKVVAIVGAGRIGRETGRLAEAFGASCVYVGRDDDLDAVLPEADVVSLHCPLTARTHHLIDARALASMRRTAVLVNTARGPIVDEAALNAALRRGALAGAALDVHEFEPSISADLVELDNVVLTPHLGSATTATREAMGLLAVEALTDVLVDGREPVNVVRRAPL